MYNVDANVSGHGEVCFPSCMVVYYYTFSKALLKILISMNIVYFTAAKTAIVLTLSCQRTLLGFQPSDSLHIQMIIITIVIINVIITITITLVINIKTPILMPSPATSVCSSKNGSSKRFHTLFSRMPLGGSRWL